MEDWINDKSDLRLNLFIQSICPDSKLDKSKKQMVISLITDYEKEKTKERLAAINKLFKSNKVNNKISNKESNKENKLTQLLKQERDERYNQRQELMDQLMQIKRMGDKTEYNKIKKELYKLEEEMGMYKENDPNAQIDTERALIRGILGDWEKQGTLGWEIINGSKPKFIMKSPFSAEYLLKLLEQHSGQKIRDFHITSNVGQGFGDSKFSAFTLVDKASGLDPEPSMKVTDMKTGTDITDRMKNMF